MICFKSESNVITNLLNRVSVRSAAHLPTCPLADLLEISPDAHHKACGFLAVCEHAAAHDAVLTTEPDAEAVIGG